VTTAAAPHRDARSMAVDAAAVLYDDVIDAQGAVKPSAGATTGAIATLNARLGALEEENATLRARCETLEKNMSCLFNTARAEVERKDKEIAALRERAGR
jgi:predicted RNase H-like nuclease (RuvC/YqgF family)